MVISLFFKDFFKSFRIQGAVVFTIILKGTVFVASTKTGHVPDFLLLELLFQVDNQLILSTGTQTGGTITDVNFFSLVFRF